jgi:hypothetical protein
MCDYNEDSSTVMVESSIEGLVVDKEELVNCNQIVQGDHIKTDSDEKDRLFGELNLSHKGLDERVSSQSEVVSKVSHRILEGEFAEQQRGSSIQHHAKEVSCKKMGLDFICSQLSQVGETECATNLETVKECGVLRESNSSQLMSNHCSEVELNSCVQLWSCAKEWCQFLHSLVADQEIRSCATVATRNDVGRQCCCRELKMHCSHWDQSFDLEGFLGIQMYQRLNSQSTSDNKGVEVNRHLCLTEDQAVWLLSVKDTNVPFDVGKKIQVGQSMLEYIGLSMAEVWLKKSASCLKEQEEVWTKEYWDKKIFKRKLGVYQYQRQKQKILDNHHINQDWSISLQWEIFLSSQSDYRDDFKDSLKSLVIHYSDLRFGLTAREINFVWLYGNCKQQCISIQWKLYRAIEFGEFVDADRLLSRRSQEETNKGQSRIVT